jgi:hypothetical protein
MSWGDKDSHGSIKCRGCGMEFVLKSQSQPMRERETLNCPKCGYELRSFNAARSYWVVPKNPVLTPDESETMAAEFFSELTADCSVLSQRAETIPVSQLLEDISGWCAKKGYHLLSDSDMRHLLGAVQRLIRGG